MSPAPHRASHSHGNGAQHLRPGQQPRADPVVLAMATLAECCVACDASAGRGRFLAVLRGRLDDLGRLNISDRSLWGIRVVRQMA